MKHAFETRDIALKNLVLHADNVRAKSGAGYSADQIAPLAANIAECGLLQPLLVAPLPKVDGKVVWGVLAGGRRLAALQTLAEDPDAKGFGLSMKIPCRVVPESQAAQVTLSYSENALQLPMDALDRYEAFAAMRARDHADVATIARTFGITERTVKEALRLGNIHTDIRQAHRDGRVSLEVLKAFDAHPDPVVQLAAFTALTETNGEQISQWQVSRYFQGRYVRVGDALGQMVLQGYMDAGGEITADLIEEDSVLADSALIETVLRKELSDAAEARREVLGLSWADYLTAPDWNATSAYGRVYMGPKDLTEEEQTTADAWALRMEEIEVVFDEDGDGLTQEALQREYDDLSIAIDALSTCYGDVDRGIGGVLAIWSGRNITYYDGMVRPEDMPSRDGEQTTDVIAGGDPSAPQDKWSEKLKSDMAHVRTRAIALALAQSPDLAQDYVAYMVIRSALMPYASCETGSTLRSERASAGPDDLAGSLKAIEDVFDSLQGQLSLDWIKLAGTAAFEGFRALSREERDMLLAYAVAQTLKPALYSKAGDTVRGLIEAEVLPNMRDVWLPDAAYFNRLTKPALLAILNTDLNMGLQAGAYEGSKKSEIVTYLSELFAAPFATLSEDQRQRVEAWCPVAMQTAQVASEEDGAGVHDASVDDLEAAA